MVDFWKETVAPNERLEVPVVVINDLYKAWSGNVNLMFMQGESIGVTMSSDNAKAVGDTVTLPCKADAIGQTVLRFSIEAPKTAGRYLLVSELTAEGQGTTRSYRDIEVK